MRQFLLGVYVCGFIMTSGLVYIALEQQKPDWGSAKKIAASTALGLVWFVLAPWLWKRAAGRAQQGHNG